MTENDKQATVGIDAPQDVIGIIGLVPLEVITQPPVTLRPGPGKLHIHIRLAPGDELQPGKSILYRVYGGEMGLEFEHNGQIVEVQDVKMPIVLEYRRRSSPEPPPRGQFSLDLGFWHRRGTGWSGQDVQWRHMVAWEKGGRDTFELGFAPSFP